MFLTIRPGVPEDLPAAFVFLAKHYKIPAADCGDVMKMWKQIMLEAECNSNVVEDTDQKEGQRITAFGVTFCVPEAVVDHALTEAPPFVWRWMLERWRGGQKVWLQKKEARQAQLSGGQVSVLAFICADPFRYEAVDLARMGNLYSAVTVRELTGYRLRYFLVECFGAAQRDRFMSHGMAVMNDYRKHRHDPELASLSMDDRPFLMGGDLKKMAQDAFMQNTALGKTALAGQPRYGFSEPEQELMKIALRGLTDQAIAEKLGLSLVAIKKRWEGIYHKVNELTFRQALQNSVDEEPVKAGRRQVLQMLAEHPEEFRPSPPKKRPARRA